MRYPPRQGQTKCGIATCTFFKFSAAFPTFLWDQIGHRDAPATPHTHTHSCAHTCSDIPVVPREGSLVLPLTVSSTEENGFLPARCEICILKPSLWDSFCTRTWSSLHWHPFPDIIIWGLVFKFYEKWHSYFCSFSSGKFWGKELRTFI